MTKKPLILGNRVLEDRILVDGSTAHVTFDPEKIYKNRLLIEANSGGGKSYALRRLFEQMHGLMPQHILDSEGEFHSLREKFDYVLAGRPGGAKGDCPATPKHAGHLARRMMELGVSVVIDLFELTKLERALFVKNYLDALIDLPRAHWRPTIIALDEAQKFCPEKGEGEATSTMSVIDLMTRGRKRGYCGILATQRLAALAKSAAAECNNFLIGRTSLDLDLDRAGKILGYPSRNREQLKRLPPGRFHAYGPAFGDEVTIVQMGLAVTSHPEAGEASAPPAPPRGKISKVLAELADLPEEAEAEARTAAELKDKVRELEARLKRQNPVNTSGKAQAPVIDRAAIDRAVAAAVQRAGLDARKHFQREMRTCFGAIEKASLDAMRQVMNLTLGRAAAEPKLEAIVQSPKNDHHKPSNGAHLPPKTESRTITSDSGKIQVEEISGPGKKLLDALAWFEAIGINDPDATSAAFLAGYSPTSGTFANVKGACRSQGLITYPSSGKLALTDTGRAAASAPDIPMTNEGMQEAILAKLDGAGQKILRALLPHGSEGLSSDRLAEETGYSGRSGTFANVKGKLRSLGLVVYPRSGQIAASIVMYPEG